MSLFEAVLQEQQAISLVMLGLLTLALAFGLRSTGRPGETTGMRQTFWSLQALLFTVGMAMVVWPSYAFAAVVVATIGGVLMVQQRQRAVAPLV